MQAISTQYNNECEGKMYHVYKLAANWKKVAACMVPSLGTQGLTCLVGVLPICTAWSQLPFT